MFVQESELESTTGTTRVVIPPESPREHPHQSPAVARVKLVTDTRRQSCGLPLFDGRGGWCGRREGGGQVNDGQVYTSSYGEGEG